MNETSLKQKLSTDLSNISSSSFETGYCVLNSFLMRTDLSAIFLSCWCLCNINFENYVVFVS